MPTSGERQESGRRIKNRQQEEAYGAQALARKPHAADGRRRSTGLRAIRPSLDVVSHRLLPTIQSSTIKPAVADYIGMPILSLQGSLNLAVWEKLS